MRRLLFAKVLVLAVLSLCGSTFAVAPGDIFGASDNSIRRYDGMTGAFLEEVSSTVGFGGAQSIDLTYGPDGNLYGRGSNAWLYKFDLTTEVKSTFISDMGGSWAFVPEPATLSLLAVASLVVIRRSRRRQGMGDGVR